MKYDHIMTRSRTRQGKSILRKKLEEKAKKKPLPERQQLLEQAKDPKFRKKVIDAYLKQVVNSNKTSKEKTASLKIIEEYKIDETLTQEQRIEINKLSEEKVPKGSIQKLLERSKNGKRSK